MKAGCCARQAPFGGSRLAEDADADSALTRFPPDGEGPRRSTSGAEYHDSSEQVGSLAASPPLYHLYTDDVVEALV